MATPATTRPTGSPRVQSPPADFLAAVRTTGAKRPLAVLFHGPPGVGKTSFGASAPRPIFGMAKGETGLETLIDAGRIGETAHFPEWLTWETALASMRSLLTGTHEYRTLVIDTLNGLERLCHEYVCARDFGGVWSDKGFASYQKGPEVALGEWRELLSLLDDLRNQRRMSILSLVHTKIGQFRNPEGSDFNMYQPDLDKRTWALTHKWSDIVLFANFYVTTVKQDGKQLGRGGQDRVLYTEGRAAYDAKNRHGLPPEISMGQSSREAWSNFAQALKAGAAKKEAEKTTGNEKPGEPAGEGAAK